MHGMRGGEATAGMLIRSAGRYCPAVGAYPYGNTIAAPMILFGNAGSRTLQ